MLLPFLCLTVSAVSGLARWLGLVFYSSAVLCPFVFTVTLAEVIC